jgi:hypothetical protein
MRRPLLIALLPLGVLLACGTKPTTAEVASTPPPTAGSAAAPTPTTSSPTPTLTSAITPTATATPTAKPAPTLPAFHSSVATVTAAGLPSSYRVGCPTPPSQLRMLTLTYVDFGGHAQTGHLVVNAARASQVVAIFADLYAHRFPIRTMVPVDAYGGSDDRSVAADNTAGFNCRAAVTSGPTSWSMHAYGEAIDLNPVENPSLLDENPHVADPPQGQPYLTTRSHLRPGMVTSATRTVFARYGWGWGGLWSDRDLMHFSSNGK